MTTAGGGPGRPPIRRLSRATVERIAAGEVVERPASVVKELVENALDAGATDVGVRLGGGGFVLVRVDDDGHGIPPDELPLAVERHATSKLAAADELSDIATLGFRGEALASIGAVARLTLTSRPRDRDEAHAVRVVGGEVEGITVVGRPPGTTVEVRDLFFNTPARRKFLRSPAAEQLEVVATLERMYLAHPGVGVHISGDAGELGRYPRVPTLRDAAAHVFGPEFLGQSFEVDAPLVPGARLRAILGRPTLHRPTSQGLHLAVNGRAVASRPIAQAVRAAYLDHLPRARFPLGVVQLEIDPHRVDVNVHPTKREVRLADERALAERVRQAVRSALLGAPQVAEPLRARTVPAAAPAPVPGPRRLPAPVARGGWGAMRPAGRQRFLGEPAAAGPVAPTARQPGLRLLGPLFDLYWVAESDGGLVLVDQHAASERVTFEALRRDGRLARQELLHPVLLRLAPKARAALDTHAPEVARAGFSVAAFGPEEVRVTAVPSFLGHRVPAEALRRLLDELADGGRPTLPDGLVDRVAASIACHASVRGGDRIAPDEMRQILERLYALPDANYACPHGRPILVTLPRSRLDRWFLRADG